MKLSFPSDVVPGLEHLAAIGWVKSLGSVMLIVGIFAATVVLVGDEEGLAARVWARYVAYLERKLRRMFLLWTSGNRIALLQVSGVFACFAAYVLIRLPLWYFWAIACLAIPPIPVERMRQKRVAAIEAQIDGFVLALANALKTTHRASATALRSILPIVREPLRRGARARAQRDALRRHARSGALAHGEPRRQPPARHRAQLRAHRTPGRR